MRIIIIIIASYKFSYYNCKEENAMLSEKNLREISKYEAVGLDVINISSTGTLDYVTHSNSNCEYCDQCPAFRLLPDPNPYDWFRSGDKKAVCLEVNGVIEGGLEGPNEWTNICKPLYCPKLGRKLSEEDIKKAQKDLQWAKERMK